MPSLTTPFALAHYHVRLAPVKKKGGPHEGQYRLYVTDTSTPDKPTQKRLYAPTLPLAVKLLATHTQHDVDALTAQFVQCGLLPGDGTGGGTTSATVVGEATRPEPVAKPGVPSTKPAVQPTTVAQPVDEAPPKPAAAPPVTTSLPAQAVAPPPPPKLAKPPVQAPPPPKPTEPPVQAPPLQPTDTTSAPASPPTLSAEQQAVIACALTGQSLFFTGSAGTGKSFVLRTLVKALKAKHGASAVFVTAPTGVAACNVGGITLHSFAGVGLGKGTAKYLADMVAKNNSKAAKWNQCQVLVIDEVSMLDGHLMDKLDAVGRRVRYRPDAPFGGIQLVLCGDFYQLPPVGVDRTTCFAFESQAWKRAVTQTFQLTHVYRQRDPVFVQCLNDLRMGVVSDATARTLKATRNHSLVQTTEDGATVVPTRLYSHNVDVDRENLARLKDLPGGTLTYKARDEAKTEAARRQMERLPASEVLQLKVGAQVILTKNIAVGSGLANGTRGVVVRFETKSVDDPFVTQPTPYDGQTDESYWVDVATCRYPVVRFLLANGTTYLRRIEPDKWTIEDGSTLIAERTQLPLRLAWALSIHKAQGMTIGLLETNVGRCFDYGQCYVALSRATSLETLRVQGFDARRVRVHPKVVAFHSGSEQATGETAPCAQ
jgi:ATP-dependent DNA helicase PIF1